jgi:capsular exopolysaccharide synthesis family protein
MESTESSLGFKQYQLALKRHWLPASAIFVSVLAFTTLSVLLIKPTYVAQGMLRFKRANTTSNLTELGKEIGQLDSLVEENTPLNTEAVSIRSAPVVQKTIAELNLKDKQGAPLKIEDFLKQLSVENITETDILQVSYKGKDPEEITAVVNTLMAVYLKSNLIGNRAEAVATREFIEKELPRAEAATRQTEEALRRFEEKNKVVALEEEASAAVEVIANLDDQIAQAQAQLANTNAQSVALRNKVGMNSQAAIATSSLSQSPGVQNVLEEYQQLQGELALQRTRYQETHPVVANLKDREAALKTLLSDRVRQVVGSQKQAPSGNLQIGELRQKLTEDLVNSEVTRLGLAREVSALLNQQSVYKQRVNAIPKLKQAQRELERRLEAAQSTYLGLLKQLQEARITENQNVGNARILESALIPEKPVAPRKALYLATGGILGILLSIATALVLEARDKSIKTVEEARELFGFSMLGVIPSFRKTKKITPYDPDPEQSALEIVVRNAPHSPISAMFRMLQANLRFLSADKELKVIVVTSSVPQEGKSVVSANLAATMAQLEHRVLLVDADMHRPTQHHIWEMFNEVGLSDVLIGQAAFQGALKTVMPNLDILTAGVMPPNPVALLGSQRMAALIETFSASYDFVIIDTPSLNVDADALTLGKMVDGVLLVVRPGVVDSASATFAKEFLEQSGQNVLGQVINGVIPENEPYNYYYSAKEYYAEESATTNGKLVTRMREL